VTSIVDASTCSGSDRKRTTALSERDARTLLFVRAIEEADLEGVLLTPQSRAAAARRAIEEVSRANEEPLRVTGVPPGQVSGDTGALLKRADLLRDEVLRKAPALVRVAHPLRFPGARVLTIAVAAIIGLSTNLLGPERHVSVLAFPFAGILAWNVLVYAGLAAKAIGSRIGRVRGAAASYGPLATMGRWVEGMTLSVFARRLSHGMGPSAVADAVERFYRLWVVTAAPLVAARLAVVLHLAALSLALGAILGMYASGIAFEYRATWESTWLEAPTVQRYLNLVLGSAARVLGVPVPDVAPLRGPEGEGSAAPWIHLWATTLGLAVLIPRAALAGLEAARAARLRKRLPIDLDSPYYWRALAGGRGTAVTVSIVYYSCDPGIGLRHRLHELLQELVGARAAILDGPALEYGEGPESVPGLDGDSVPGLLVLVFPLAQTPESEVHGEFLERVQARAERAGSHLMVVLETATYRRRIGSEERVRERRSTWDRLLRELHLTAVELDEAGAADERAAVDSWVDRARRGVWTGPA